MVRRGSESALIAPLRNGPLAAEGRRVTLTCMGGRTYPTCTAHGAMNKIGDDIWRCLAQGCNIGCRYPVEPS